MRRFSIPGFLSLVFATFAGVPMTAIAQQDDVLQTARRVKAEENVQNDSRRRITLAVKRIAFLLEDLESNGLLAEADGPKIAKLNQALQTVGNRNVPKAAGLLRNARANIKNALPFLRGAEKEITLIIKELDLILEGAGALLADERLIKELDAIIKKQEQLNGQVAKWVPLLRDSKASAGDATRIENSQRAITERYNEFFKLLQQAVRESDAETGKRFAAAEKVLGEGKPEALLEDAATSIGTAESPEGGLGAALAGGGKQLEATKILRKALQILTEDASGLAELLKDLTRIIAEQKALKKKIETTKQFAKDQSQFEASQINITRDIGAWVNIESLAGGPLEAPIREGHVASKLAEKEIKAGKKPQAVNAQEEVIAALERALLIATAELEKEASDIQDPTGGEGSETGEGTETDGVLDGAGADPGFSDPGFADLGFGSEGTPGAGSEGAEGAGMGMGMGAGMGMGEGMGMGMGAGMGMGQGMGMGMGMGSPTPFAGDPKDLEESSAAGSSSTVAKGDKIKQGRQAREIFNRRKRSAAIQKFVQQLPPEFRKLVAEYYEALAE